MPSNATKLEYVRVERLGACARCPLAVDRRWIVFGDGDAEADVMIIGDAPGMAEDVMGQPFVGKAGAFLDKMLQRYKLPRPKVYATNLIKCRPPNNRDPDELEVSKCSPYLHAQIAIVRPRVIITLGRFSGAHLSGRAEDSMGELYEPDDDLFYRNEKTRMTVPIVALYHPSFVLRQRGTALEIHLAKFVKGLLAVKELLAS